MASSSLKKLDSSTFDEWKAQHLLNRAGFGGTQRQITILAGMGLDKAVEYMIEYDRVKDPSPVKSEAFDNDIMRPLNQSERQMVKTARRGGDEATLEMFRQERQRRQRADRKQVSEMEEWWLKRMIETPRPLEEKLTLFWHGHFATGYRTIENSFHMYQQNAFFRTFAMGNFKEDLVRGIVHDPAMIQYLNNHQNRKEAPNENLARELMELFTLGEGEGYTEDDIKEGARTLTGYTFDDDSFSFNRTQHDTGVKTIFGRRGQFDGDDFVDLIFTRPSVSTYIIWKLYRFFINDLPHGPTREATNYVNQLASVFKRNKWNIKSVMKAMLLSEHFYDEQNVQTIIKSPIQLIVQAMRTVNPPDRKKLLRTLSLASNLMGQKLFAPPSVKGWDGGRAWISTSTMFMRQNTLLFLLTGQRPDGYAWDADSTKYDALSLLGANTSSPKVAVRYLLTTLLCTPNIQREREEALLDYLKTQHNVLDNQTTTGLLTLITSMPEYQLC
ncbi:MAG: DUF1800 domain-containing protein [Phycisphaerales bacterium]|jgi:uncharacterized protein (DUF1800 family)|nr:DUF1800 domain-containing protein [Phycisphaerales bacterium]